LAGLGKDIFGKIYFFDKLVCCLSLVIPWENTNCDTQRFKKNKTTSVERVFLRLLATSMQNPAVKVLRAVRNHFTIAYRL
jgi:hypothetical protein